MKFYFDFEATQFSGRIISIGCSSEKGDTFQSLMKPSKSGDKVGNFVTELTGITQDIVETAPSADKVFLNLRAWIIEQCKDELPQYFCYGDSDVHFIAQTVKYMQNFEAVVFASSIQAMIIDYSKEITNILQLSQPVALCKMYIAMKAENYKQNHNALEDALMLQYVAEHFDIAYKSNFFEIMDIPAIKIATVKTPTKVLAPEIFINWPKDKMHAKTGATETDWNIKACLGKDCKYFNDDYTMALWAIKYLTQGKSPKKEKDIKEIIRCVDSSIKGNRKYLGARWERKEMIDYEL